MRLRRTSALRVSAPEPIRPGDPDYALVRARRRQPADAFLIREIKTSRARLKKARARSFRLACLLPRVPFDELGDRRPDDICD